jgi:hypothetical protein
MIYHFGPQEPPGVGKKWGTGLALPRVPNRDFPPSSAAIYSWTDCPRVIGWKKMSIFQQFCYETLGVIDINSDLMDLKIYLNGLSMSGVIGDLNPILIVFFGFFVVNLDPHLHNLCENNFLKILFN